MSTLLELENLGLDLDGHQVLEEVGLDVGEGELHVLLVANGAAIGSVDRRQLESLMARGLAPDDAMDRIILGMLG